MSDDETPAAGGRAERGSATGPAEEEVTSPFRTPAPSCPKCERPQRDGETACARCGLSVDRWTEFDPAAGEPPALAIAWGRLVDAWGDPEAHDRILELATEKNAIPHLVRHYHATLRTSSTDPIAAARLKRVMVLCEHGVRAAAAEPVNTSLIRAVWYLGYFVGIGGVALAGWFLLRAWANR